ncbi:hypothetical protein B0H14DRAFT_2834261 [Mycena olivaceomarginata]|nr:hypothetical protein B0H14DRAFT_2834261 [Mycena olivaceomarginata]
MAEPRLSTIIEMASHLPSLTLATEASAPAQQRPQHRRCRTLSVSIPLAGTASKIIFAVPSSPSPSAAQVAAGAGAFTLTGCARAALRGLVLATSDDESDLNEDSYADREYMPPHRPTRRSLSDKEVPSISRTASPFEGERAPVPPGWGARPRKAQWPKRGRSRSQDRSEYREQQSESRRATTRIHPTLEGLERGSRVGTGRVVCAGCGTSGVNFPRCPRCTKMWCSRACRTAPGHLCPSRRSQTS